MYKFKPIPDQIYTFFQELTKDTIAPVNVSPMGLSLIPAVIDPKYRKQWNIYLDDFVHLAQNGVKISDTLYRVGGMGNPDLRTQRYFMLLKQVQSHYPRSITQHTGSDPKHLASHWAILDTNGVEKVVVEPFTSPYLIEDSCVWAKDNQYYHIETGEFYCKSYSRMESDDFIFLENQFDENKARRGVMKISKADGSWELFKGK